jgi:hypothetical protein
MVSLFSYFLYSTTFNMTEANILNNLVGRQSGKQDTSICNTKNERVPKTDNSILELVAGFRLIKFITLSRSLNLIPTLSL